MKKYIVSLLWIVLIPCVSPAQSTTDSIDSRTVFSELTGIKKKTDKFNLFLNMHGGFNAKFQDGFQEGAFEMKQLRIEAKGDVNDWHNREGIVDLYYKDISTYVLKMRGVENYQIDKKLLKQIKNKIVN